MRRYRKREQFPWLCRWGMGLSSLYLTLNKFTVYPTMFRHCSAAHTHTYTLIDEQNTELIQAILFGVFILQPRSRNCVKGRDREIVVCWENCRSVFFGGERREGESQLLVDRLCLTLLFPACSPSIVSIEWTSHYLLPFTCYFFPSETSLDRQECSLHSRSFVLVPTSVFCVLWVLLGR